jgi:hypothetical protein
MTCPFCKESVVVPKAELDKGILYCTECDTGVGVCTGKRFSKGRGGAYMNGSKQPDIFEAISADLARYDQEAELKKQKEDFARQQQGHEYKQGT